MSTPASVIQSLLARYGTPTGVAAPTAVPAAGGQSPTAGRYAGMSAQQIHQSMNRTGFTQEGVNAIYAMRGLANPPTIPFEGFRRGAGRDVRIYGSDGKPLSGSVKGQANDFLNTFGRTAVDPFVGRSGISSVAGGLLNLGMNYVGGPAGQALTAVADYGNRALGNNDGTSYTDGRRSGADRIGAAVGAVGSAVNAPGSYGATQSRSPTTDPTGGAPGTQAGPVTSGSGGDIFRTGSGGNMPGASGGWMDTLRDWIPTIINAGASIVGSDRAGDRIDRSSAAALAENARQFDLVRSDTAGVRALGNAGVASLARLYGYDDGTPDPSVFTTSPEYSFNLSEGQKGIDRSLLARGGALSGAGVKEGIRFASGMASRESAAFIDRLFQQAGIGSTGIAASANAGANSASNVAGIETNRGNTRASIYMDNAANINNAVQAGYSNNLLRRYLDDRNGG